MIRKFILTLIFIVGIPMSAFADVVYDNDWNFRMEVPDHFSMRTSDGPGIIGQLTDNRTGTITISAIDNPEYRNVRSFTDAELKGLVAQQVRSYENMNERIVDVQYCLTNAHKHPYGYIESESYINGVPKGKLTAILFAHGRTFLVTIRDLIPVGSNKQWLEDSVYYVKSIDCLNCF